MMNKLKSISKKNLLGPVRAYHSLKAKVLSKVIRVFPGKITLNLGALLVWGGAAFLAVVIAGSLLFSPEDLGSFYETQSSSPSGEESGEIEGLSEEGPTQAKSLKGVIGKKGQTLSGDDSGPQRNHRVTLKFQGKQVLVRASSQGDRALPTGTNFVGELLSNVDTRSTDKFVRVQLPFGGRFKDKLGLPKKTILLGNINYPGKGNRIFIEFHRGVLPSGEEIELSARAMDAKDFSPGLIGSYHSAFGSRAGATLGFSFMAGASDVLQEREALGQGQVVTKKATMKNALLNGVSEFAETEGAFQLEEARNEGAYVTLHQGRELIITLTETFKKEDKSL